MWKIYAENFNIGQIIMLPKQFKEFVGLYCYWFAKIL